MCSSSSSGTLSGAARRARHTPGGGMVCSHHTGLWSGAISYDEHGTLQVCYLEDLLRDVNPESHLERRISFSVHHLEA